MNLLKSHDYIDRRFGTQQQAAQIEAVDRQSLAGLLDRVERDLIKPNPNGHLLDGFKYRVHISTELNPEIK